MVKESPLVELPICYLMICLVWLQPPARESGPSKTGHDVRASSHDFPDEARAVVLHGQNDGPLIDTKLVGRHPPAYRNVVHAERPVERAPEPVGPVLAAQIQSG